MKTDVLRRRFIEFFQKNGHRVFSSDTLVPQDSSVLFTSAGMNQFKPYFLGEKKDVSRAVSVQKCLRTDDLAQVGKTAFHHTFFEMLGNFSFGDYFKKETIRFAWDFLLQELLIRENNLWISVYFEDDEAYHIWKNNIGIAPERIVKLGAKDNFWPSNAPQYGPDGPCGPCSEIFFDWGKDVGCGKKECSPACSCGRFVEIWNLVFTQYNRRGENHLLPLPQKNIDTGMGLERMASVLQGKQNNFQIDIIAPLVAETAELLKVVASDRTVWPVLHAIVDHVRAASFSIVDGVYPSNEERGYVIRKIIRKAFWHGYSCGCTRPFLYKLVPRLVDLMKDAYPEIGEGQKNIAGVIRNEEERFLSTIEAGKTQLQHFLNKEKGSSILEGKDAFVLYDTYGFPLELLQEYAQEHGLQLDRTGFEQCLENQRSQSRKKSMFQGTIFAEDTFPYNDTTSFVGYTHFSIETHIIRILSEEEELAELKENEQGYIILNETPFYPESGGQSADTGVLRDNGNLFLVEEVKKIKTAILHRGRVIKGFFHKTRVVAQIDMVRRAALMRAHTATHLLQSALRSVLGTHVVQQGSLVEADRLRFDFTHFRGLTFEELEEIEKMVNYFVIQGYEVTTKEMPFQDAKQAGALAFFKDKYSQNVRVVSIAGCSQELCGGTHLDTVAKVGVFCITQESSISSGIRRIEALVGESGYRYFLEVRTKLRMIAQQVKSSEQEVVPMVKRCVEDLKKTQTLVTSLEQKIIAFKMNDIIAAGTDVKGIKVIAYRFEESHDYASLLFIADQLRNQFGSLFLFLVSEMKQKNIFIVGVTDAVAETGIIPQGFLNRYRNELGLKGGGKGLTAQGIIQGTLSMKSIRSKIRHYIETGE